MITEKELKDRCTSEIVKKMVELAEGFTSYSNGIFMYREHYVYSLDTSRFALLVHRTVEGFNKIDCDESISVLNTALELEFGNETEKYYHFENYQSELLTQLECASLHCLIEIFKGVEND